MSRVPRSRVTEDPQELEEFDPEQVFACWASLASRLLRMFCLRLSQ